MFKSSGTDTLDDGYHGSDTYGGIASDGSNYGGSATFSQNDVSTTESTNLGSTYADLDALGLSGGTMTTVDLSDWESHGRNEVDDLSPSGAGSFTDAITLNTHDSGKDSHHETDSSTYGTGGDGYDSYSIDDFTSSGTIGENDSKSTYGELDSDNDIRTVQSNDPTGLTFAETDSGGPTSTSTGTAGAGFNAVLANALLTGLVFVPGDEPQTIQAKPAPPAPPVKPWNLSPNFKDAFGDLVASKNSGHFVVEQSSKLTDQNMLSIKNILIKEIYEQLKTFELFSVGGNNVAEVNFIAGSEYAEQYPDANLQKRQFAAFVQKGAAKFFTTKTAGQSDGKVYVELFYNDKNHTVTAYTLGNHMIVGVRKWHVDGYYKDGQVVVNVETIAWEQRNSFTNDFGFNHGFPPYSPWKAGLAHLNSCTFPDANCSCR